MIGLLVLLLVVAVPAIGMAQARAWAAGLTLATLAFSVVAFAAYCAVGLGTCESDLGDAVPHACDLLPLAFPFAPLVVTGAAIGAYAARRTWPLGVGLVAAAAMVAVPVASV